MWNQHGESERTYVCEPTAAESHLRSATYYDISSWNGAQLQPSEPTMDEKLAHGPDSSHAIPNNSPTQLDLKFLEIREVSNRFKDRRCANYLFSHCQLISLFLFLRLLCFFYALPIVSVVGC